MLKSSKDLRMISSHKSLKHRKLSMLSCRTYSRSREKMMKKKLTTMHAQEQISITMQTNKLFLPILKFQRLLFLVVKMLKTLTNLWLMLLQVLMIV